MRKGWDTCVQWRKKKNPEKGSDLEVLSNTLYCCTGHSLSSFILQGPLWGDVVQPWLKLGPIQTNHDCNTDIHHLNVINTIEVFVFFTIRNKRRMCYYQLLVENICLAFNNKYIILQDNSILFWAYEYKIFSCHFWENKSGPTLPDFLLEKWNQHKRKCRHQTKSEISYYIHGSPFY